MTFSDQDKLKALAIVNIFETSRPFGDYAACVVLNDGAGVSYGINQFTHRSGSLRAVVERYLANGGSIGREVLTNRMPILRWATSAAIRRLASDEQFKKALRAAAVTREMKDAQRQIALERYLRPALDVCETRRFVLPLSLAVIYDSVTHGNFGPIAARLSGPVSEKAWITEYVRKRHFWLTNIPRLKATSYRTKFFLDQIAIGDWDLRLPLNVHGVRLMQSMFTSFDEKAVEPVVSIPPKTSSDPQIPTTTPAQIPQAQPPAGEMEEKRSGGEGEGGFLEMAADAVGNTADKFDRVEGIVAAVAERKDAAKSLWTTVTGTVWQMAWAVFGFVVGLPIEVWIAVAVIVAVLTLFYLYRQIALGKLRETAPSQPRTTND